MPSSPLEAVISNNVCQHNNRAFQYLAYKYNLEHEERVSLKFISEVF